MHKSKDFETQIKRIQEFKKTGMKIVFANGCFDLLHEGHKHLIREAKQQGDILVVGLNSDESVKRLKGDDRPIQSQTMRSKALLELDEVDEVILFAEDTPETLIKILSPNVLVKGEDYIDKEVVGARYVTSQGGCVHYASFLEGYSTTLSIKKSLSGKDKQR